MPFVLCLILLLPNNIGCSCKLHAIRSAYFYLTLYQPYRKGILQNVALRVAHVILYDNLVQENGKVCAVGSADGCTTIVQLSEGLVQQQPSEKRVITAVSPFPCLPNPLHWRR